MNNDVSIALLCLVLGIGLAITGAMRGKGIGGKVPDILGAFSKYWRYLLAFVGIGLLMWMYYTDISLVDIIKWAAKHWPFVVIAGVSGYVAILFAANRTVSGDVDWPKLASPLKSLGIYAGVTLLVLTSPVGEWVAKVGGGEGPVVAKSFTMPPGGKSELIPTTHGLRVVMDGDKFRLHTVYRDGRDCAYREKDSCPDGPILGVYAVNEDAVHPNTVSYTHAK